MLDFTEWNIPVLNNINDNNLLLITKLTIKTYLQSISLTKKKKYSVKALFTSHFISEAPVHFDEKKNWFN